MPTAAILGFNDAYASVIGGFADMLQVANSHMRKQGIQPTGLFEWHFVSVSFPRFFVCQRMGFMLPVFPDAAL